ncbi:hypothetical protein P175DRAFT_0167767 [Aspergillus ochraceoroseus IBT 24754]|uniref:Uncharacterized protein n=1 Tax=Aspergillus ochraceoroseus IBT 24754 TaxID=1392256 RepID=A0A2T5M465_9EURO|nr:uncharacterized protein P175DRAFT_0167767 [Aspergillus ochraceoroseus IBT 24754]PTU23328.1 hypothetical protein P175DRAFT_0167767 [Aspergillus ochraceoroseus IBT 24754]
MIRSTCWYSAWTRIPAGALSAARWIPTTQSARETLRLESVIPSSSERYLTPPSYHVFVVNCSVRGLDTSSTSYRLCCSGFDHGILNDQLLFNTLVLFLTLLLKVSISVRKVRTSLLETTPTTFNPLDPPVAVPRFVKGCSDSVCYRETWTMDKNPANTLLSVLFKKTIMIGTGKKIKKKAKGSFN